MFLAAPPEGVAGGCDYELGPNPHQKQKKIQVINLNYDQSSNLRFQYTLRFTRTSNFILSVS